MPGNLRSEDVGKNPVERVNKKYKNIGKRLETQSSTKKVLNSFSDCPSRKQGLPLYPIIMSWS